MRGFKKLPLNVNLNYTLLQSSFLCITATIVNFSIIFLGSKGLGNTEVGLALSLGQILTIIIQPILGNFADRNPNIPLKYITISILIIQAILCVLLLFVNSPILIVMILFIIINSALGLLMTLINSLGMRYKNSGYIINFSFARGIGALVFAVAGFFIGFIIERTGTIAFIPITLFFIIATAAVMLLSISPQQTIKDTPKKKLLKEPFFKSLFKIFKYNPATIFVFFSIMMISFNHIMMDVYQIRVILDIGGNSEQYGLLILIMAACEVPPMLLLERIAKKFSYGAILTFAFSVYVIKDIMIALSPNVTVLLLAQALNLFSVGFYFTATIYYINDLVSKSQTVRGQALLYGLSMGIGSIIGTTAGGLIIDAASASTLFMWCSGVAAVGTLLIWMSIIVNKNHLKSFDKKADLNMQT